MSHELRTPLSAILGFSQLLEFDQDDALSDERKLYVSHIYANGEHLLALINDLLDLAKIDAGQVSTSVERVVLGDIITSLESTLLPLAKASSITVRFHLDKTIPDVLADRTRLNQVLLNLCTNAVKYNRLQGRVDITSEKRGGEWVRLTVADTGQGIPQARHGEVFEPFNRLGRETSAIEGTGVGLSLSRRLMQLMGGSLDFSSRPGEGSRFWIDIPVYVASSETEEDKQMVAEITAQESGKSSPIQEKTVLCVDDNLFGLELVTKTIGNIPGTRVLTATSAEDGIALARQHCPEIILMDINLPGMDGITALAELKRYPETRSISVFALSAAASPKDIERGLAAGFDQYLTKPYNVRALLKAITEALTRSGPV